MLEYLTIDGTRKNLTDAMKLKEFYEKYERYISPGAFILGFLWDNLTLTRVDLLFDNLILTTYLALATFGIITLYAQNAGSRIFAIFGDTTSKWLSLLVQFSFGGLFSGYIIYYTKSASFVGDWPFLLFLAAFFIGNEVFKKRYQFLTFQLSILFIVIFSYSIFSVPILLNRIGTDVFLMSAVVSLAAFSFVLLILASISDARLSENKHSIIKSTAVICFLFNLAYFTNVIPPIPLSLKEIGVYHLVAPLPGEKYKLTYEPPPWYRSFESTSNIFHRKANEPVYVYGAVFAPAKLNISVTHRWSYYDNFSYKWFEAGRVSFPVTGGRDLGYRGYSVKENVFPAKWRVDVLTNQGKIIGRINFSVVESEDEPKIKTIIK